MVGGLEKEKIRKAVGFDVELVEASYVSREELLPKVIDSYLTASDLDPLTKAKLEKFVRGEKTWDSIEEYHRLMDMKSGLLYNARGIQGLYEPDEDSVYIIKDSVENFVPYFRAAYEETWEQEYVRFKELIELHEFVHRAHFNACPRFREHRKATKERKQKTLRELMDSSLSRKVSGGNIELTIPAAKKPLYDEWLRLDTELQASHILAEGLAYWATRKFYEANDEYRNAGDVFSKIILGESSGKPSLWKAHMGIIDELYVSHGEGLLKALDMTLDYDRSAAIVKRVKGTAG